MPIYIAKTYEGDVESVVLAKSPELANAYWQGQGVIAHSVIVRSEADLNGHLTGVLPIINTKKISVTMPGGFHHKEVRIISKR